MLEPLQRLRVTCDGATVLSCDLTWEGSFPAVLEDAHLLMSPAAPDAGRLALRPDRVVDRVAAGRRATRSRSTRRCGSAPATARGASARWATPTPPGASADLPGEGFWWLYVPMRFETFQLMLIVQEQPDGFRTLSHASRVFADGRVEQLGWPRIEIDYRSGTRHPERARCT